MINSENKSSLFERIGGMAAVDAAVEIFYTKVLLDERVAPFFRWIDMSAQTQKQKAFLAYAFGADSKYSGKDLRKAHAKLVEGGLGDVQFDIIISYLRDTMYELKIDEDSIREAIHIAECTRNDVLCKQVG